MQPTPTRLGSPLVGLLLIAASLGGCNKPSRKAPKPLEGLQWEGIALGMSTEQVKARLEALGWSTTCQTPNTLVYLDGNALLTRWVKRADRKRAHRCDSRFTPPKTSPDGPGRLRAKTFFLDGTLRQLTVVVEWGDAALSKELRRRWGTYQQTDLELYLYSSRRPGRLRALAFRRNSTTVLWLRKAKIHELIFVSHTPAAVKALRAVASMKKNE